jgi:serine/threonine protein kinase/tetratricopeptide (TPR) repeat protein
MGEVWRGRHKGQDLPVAVKILTRRDTLDARYEIGFREEVRAAASLDHPNIVTVYDYGRTTLETEEFTNGRYANGSPYLVMELVDGFPLKQLCGRVAWNTLHRLLMALLDSLGHAHARGVIHRDLKPHNVMIAYDADRALEVKLTDFGLAHAMHHDAVNPFLDRMAGTPNYMAPEQVLVSWRDYGPWTDLYAVGCLAHALVDGKPPFAGRGARAILRAHLEDPPPIILGDVPDGFRLWVNRLLEKEPARRYACAADAAWALKRLNDEAPFNADDAAATRLDMAMVQSSDALDPSILVSEVRHTLSWAKDEWSRDESGSFLPGSEVPRVPQEWRGPIDLSWNPLVGAGLGLWGLRTLPLVGRDTERDRLWRMLTDVHADGRPRAAVLEGPSGFGKSRLARWVSERAAEFGVAAIIEATHSPLGGTHDGLSAAFARFHQCHGLGRSPTTVRLSKALRAMGETNEEVWHQLAEVLFTPQAGEDAPRISPRRRRSILMAHLQRLARRRPILLMVDDAHWGAEALDFVRSVLTRDDLHVMSVLTSDGTAEITGAERVALGPLNPAAMHDLLSGRLGLDKTLSGQVEERAEGNPLFAIQLVGDWVQRGELQPADKGFQLAAGVKPRLPDSIHAVWVDRLDEIFGNRADDQDAFELAALLGPTVAADEWAAACKHGGLKISDDLVELLLEGGLARRPLRDRPEWAFSHGLLRQSVLRLIKEGGRVVAHNAACAAALGAVTKRPWLDERRARHLMAAGDYEAALEPLIQATWERLLESQHDASRALLDEWQRLVARLNLAPDDPRRGDGWLLTCRIARLKGQDQDKARRLAHAAETEGRTYGWTRVIARTLVDRAWDAFNTDDRLTAIQRLAEAAKLAGELGDGKLQANCLRNQAVFQLDRGDPRDVAKLLQKAVEAYQQLKHPQGLGLAHINLAQLARRRDHYARAQAHLDDAARTFSASDTRWGIAMVLAERGLLYTVAGDEAGAEKALVSAIERYEIIGGVNAPLAKLYLAELRTSQGRYDEAWGMFEVLRKKFLGQKRQGRALLAVLGLLTVAAADQDWTSWNARLNEARALIDTQPATRDACRMTETAARAALKRQAAHPAAGAWTLAVEQWHELDDKAAIVRVEAERDRAEALARN